MLGTSPVPASNLRQIFRNDKRQVQHHYDNYINSTDKQGKVLSGNIKCEKYSPLQEEFQGEEFHRSGHLPRKRTYTTQSKGFLVSSALKAFVFDCYYYLCENVCCCIWFVSRSFCYLYVGFVCVVHQLEDGCNECTRPPQSKKRKLGNQKIYIYLSKNRKVTSKKKRTSYRRNSSLSICCLYVGFVCFVRRLLCLSQLPGLNCTLSQTAVRPSGSFSLKNFKIKAFQNPTCNTRSAIAVTPGYVLAGSRLKYVSRRTFSIGPHAKFIQYDWFWGLLKIKIKPQLQGNEFVIPGPQDHDGCRTLGVSGATSGV